MLPQLSERPGVFESKGWREALKRFVEQQHAARNRQRTSQRDHLALPAGNAACGPRPHQMELGQHFVDLVQPIPGLPPWKIERQHRKTNILFNAHVRNQAPILWRVANSQSGAMISG